MKFLVIAVAFLLSCTTPPRAYYVAHFRCQTPPDGEATSLSCLETPEVGEYLSDLEAQIWEAWRLPSGVSPDQEAILRFALRRDGSIQCMTLSPDVNRKYERSLLSALQQAVPFDPLPAEAHCLAGRPISAHFKHSQPTSRGAASEGDRESEPTRH